MTAEPRRSRLRRVRRIASIGLAGPVALLLASCAAGTLAGPASSPTGSPVGSPSAVGRPTATGPTLVVTVPELLVTGTGSSTAAAPVTTTPSADATAPVVEAPVEPVDTGEAPPTDEPPPAAATDAPAQPTAAPVPPAAAPTGDGLNVSLANCDGCDVLATHRDVAGGRSAALVSTGSGRGILLSVGADGQVAGVIGVPYGAAFAAPADGVLPCARGRCVVQARQPDGRAILSAFELTDSGAWRDVSGDDAFPSATERSAVVDLDGDLAIAVQDQGDGTPVWMLYTWGGDRYVVLGCAADGDPPDSAGAVSPSACLS